VGDKDQTKTSISDDLARLRRRIEALEQKAAQPEPAGDQASNSEPWFRRLFNSLEEAVFVVTPDRVLVDLNDAALAMFGYSRQEMVGRSTALLHVDSDHFERFGRRINQVFGSDQAVRFEFRLKRKNGDVFPSEHTVSLMTDQSGQTIGLVSIVRDITERLRTEKNIRSALDEKEVLLREIHHRVKNNLQITSSLLSLQSKYIEDERARSALADSLVRISAMALVHETLYQSENLSRVDLGQYLTQLSRYVYTALGPDAEHIRMDVDIQGVTVAVDQAIPGGLVVSELLTNALKHAFPKGRDGRILIQARQEADAIELVVADDGVGLPDSFASRDSLGLSLVHDLVQKQLKGRLMIDRTHGASYTIRFKVTGADNQG
jgi:PAS domain S-box-containing protein